MGVLYTVVVRGHSFLARNFVSIIFVQVLSEVESTYPDDRKSYGR